MTRRDFVTTAAATSGLSPGSIELEAVAGARLPEAFWFPFAAPASARIFERRRIGTEIRWLVFDSLDERERAWDEVASGGGSPALGEFTLFRRK